MVSTETSVEESQAKVAELSAEAAHLRSRVDDLETELRQVQAILKTELSAPPPPPKHLQIRVVGWYPPVFIESGHSSCDQLERILGAAGKGLKDFPTVLDFGCGCGRIIRAVRQRLPGHSLFGVDIDAEAIGWLKEHYQSVARFELNPHVPPGPFADGMFDLVYSISIFTHLPEDMQFAWLSELRRIAKPGAYLLLTTHGESTFSHVKDPAGLSELKDRGFYYMGADVVTTPGLPAFYQTSFHTQDYIRREWGRYFDVVAIEADGYDKRQDTVLLRRP